MNVEAENEHFEISDLLISWMENHKTCPNVSDADKNHNNNLSDDDTTDITEFLRNTLPPTATAHHHLSAPGVACNLIKLFSEKQGHLMPQDGLTEFQVHTTKDSPSPQNHSPVSFALDSTTNLLSDSTDHDSNSNVRMRGNDEWAPPRAQIIFNVHEDTNFRRLMQKQNYLCAGCGTKIDLELARRLVLYCHYLGKYFCKCCFSHKAIHLPGYILQKWDFHKYPVSHFALQLLDRIANEPLFNINDINPSLYRKVKKLKHLVDIRMQLYYLKIYISTCTQTDKLSGEYALFSHQHLLQDDVHLYSLNNLIEVQHGKLYEYLNDLVTRSISHIAQCDRCRAKGHYCQLCGPSSLMSSMITSNNGQQSEQTKDSPARLKHSSSDGQNISAASSTKPSEGLVRQQVNHSRSASGTYSSFNQSSILLSPGSNATGQTLISVNVNDHELIFPFEIGRVAQCRACGCCFHIQCFIDAGRNCPKCERIQRRRAEVRLTNASGSVETQPSTKTTPTTATVTAS